MNPKSKKNKNKEIIENVFDGNYNNRIIEDQNERNKKIIKKRKMEEDKNKNTSGNLNSDCNESCNIHENIDDYIIEDIINDIDNNNVNIDVGVDVDVDVDVDLNMINNNTYVTKKDFSNFINLLKTMQTKIKFLENQRDNSINNKSITHNNNIDNRSNTTNNINNNTNTVNNSNIVNNNQTINQTINIVGFGQEDHSKLNKSKILKCLTAGRNYPADMTLYVNFNKDFPENHNIQIPNINSGTIVKYDGYKWSTQIFDEFYDEMISTQLDYYENIKEENDIIYQKLNERVKQHIDKAQNLSETDPKFYKLSKKKFKHAMNDNRSIPMTTYKSIKSKQ